MNCNDSPNVISGTVIEQYSEQPIAFTNILLKHKDSNLLSEHYLKGVTTDSLGYFEIEIGRMTSDQLLYIGKLGFEPLIINNLDKALDQKEFKLVKRQQRHIDFLPESLESSKEGSN